MAENKSFLPEDYLEKRVQRRTNVFSLSLFAVVMAGVIAAFFVTDRQRAQVRAEQKIVNDRFEDAARKIDQLDKLQKQKEQMMRKAKVTATLLERVPRSLLLAELINNMPSTVGLLNFELDTKVTHAPAPVQTALDRARSEVARANGTLAQADEAAPDITDVTIQLTGVAPTDVQVAQFMAALSKSPMFTDLNLGYSEEMVVEGHALRKFRVDLRLNQDLDVSKIEPKMVRRLDQNPMNNVIVIDGNKKLEEINKKPPIGAAPLPVHN